MAEYAGPPKERKKKWPTAVLTAAVVAVTDALAASGHLPVALAEGVRLLGRLLGVF